ncbi:DNA gyrase inhibitor YacG [Thalassoglobus sp.]|uniref:DNA gyrase inhibitor YacG n=1 Tax=Thalassoglobus sp. TaxID=2795869 RepID=UPI003AA8F4DC
MIHRLPCPICDKELPIEIDGNSTIFPFCSPNCKNVDLYRWMNGEYFVSEKLTPEEVYEKISQLEATQEELPPESGESY